MTKNGQSWDDIRQYYLSFGEGPWLERHRPILALISWIEEESLSEILFGAVGMSGLWISDRPSSPFKDGNMLQISMLTFDSILFEYQREYASTDGMKRIVPVAESSECLRQFLTYKFGIHRSQKGIEANGSANALQS